jgi:hypothetical protein
VAKAKFHAKLKPGEGPYVYAVAPSDPDNKLGHELEGGSKFKVSKLPHGSWYGEFKIEKASVPLDVDYHLDIMEIDPAKNGESGESVLVGTFIGCKIEKKGKGFTLVPGHSFLPGERVIYGTDPHEDRKKGTVYVRLTFDGADYWLIPLNPELIEKKEHRGDGYELGFRLISKGETISDPRTFVPVMVKSDTAEDITETDIDDLARAYAQALIDWADKLAAEQWKAIGFFTRERKEKPPKAKVGFFDLLGGAIEVLKLVVPGLGALGITVKAASHLSELIGVTKEAYGVVKAAKGKAEIVITFAGNVAAAFEEEGSSGSEMTLEKFASKAEIEVEKRRKFFKEAFLEPIRTALVEPLTKELLNLAPAKKREVLKNGKNDAQDIGNGKGSKANPLFKIPSFQEMVARIAADFMNLNGYGIHTWEPGPNPRNHSHITAPRTMAYHLSEVLRGLDELGFDNDGRLFVAAAKKKKHMTNLKDYQNFPSEGAYLIHRGSGTASGNVSMVVNGTGSQVQGDDHFVIDRAAEFTWADVQIDKHDTGGGIATRWAVKKGDLWAFIALVAKEPSKYAGFKTEDEVKVTYGQGGTIARMATTTKVDEHTRAEDVRYKKFEY